MISPEVSQTTGSVPVPARAGMSPSEPSSGKGATLAHELAVGWLLEEPTRLTAVAARRRAGSVDPMTDHSSPETTRIVESLAYKAWMLEDFGRVQQAEAAFDDALSLLAPDRPTFSVNGSVCLVKKGCLLQRWHREAEAAVVFTSASSAPFEVTADVGDRETPRSLVFFGLGRAGELKLSRGLSPTKTVAGATSCYA